MHMPSSQEVLDFWYAPEMRTRWFDSTPQLDDEIRQRFETLWQAAARGELDHWRNEPESCLALTIILDQFPLNMFRATAKSFSTEHLAIEVAKYAVAQGFDHEIDPQRLAFLYMPLMHSENLADQNAAVKLFHAAGLQENARFAEHHREIIRRFGRFPHRNAALGRDSSAEEQAYLASEQGYRG